MSSNSSQKSDSPKHKGNLFVTVGSIVILIISAIAFVFVPASVGGNGRNDDIPVYGYFRKEPIKHTDEDFLRNLEQQINQFRSQGVNVDDPGNYLSVLYSAFTSTVVDKACKYEVKKAGYIAPESSINRAIQSYMLSRTGSFSPKDYNQLSNSDKLTLRKQVTETMYSSIYLNDMFGSHPYGYPTEQSSFGLKISSAEVPFVFNMNSPSKAFELVAFPLSNYPAEELVKYGNSHAALFKTVNFEVITVSAKAEAQKIAKRIANNEITFEDAVSEYSNKNFTDVNGVLSGNAVHQLKELLHSDEDLETLLQLGVGNISDVIETGVFFSIFKCCDSAKDANFDKVETLDSVYAYISSNDFAVIEDYFTAKARDFAADAAVAGFDAACKKYDVVKQTTEAFPLNYGSNDLLGVIDQNVPVLAGAATNEDFLKKAFSLKLNEVSSPITLKSNVIVLKLVSEEAVNDELIDSMKMIYPYNVMLFDDNTITNYFSTAEYVKNDVITAYLSTLDRN